MSSLARGLDERTLRLIVGALGAVHLLLGLYMLVAPSSFFHRIGTYGLENTHYVGDLGAFVLALGIALLLAVGRPAWRAPLLAIAALWYAFHALNHLLDVGEAPSDARGVADTLLFAIGAAILGWLSTAAGRTVVHHSGARHEAPRRR